MLLFSHQKEKKATFSRLSFFALFVSLPRMKLNDPQKKHEEHEERFIEKICYRR